MSSQSVAETTSWTLKSSVEVASAQHGENTTVQDEILIWNLFWWIGRFSSEPQYKIHHLATRIM